MEQKIASKYTSEEILQILIDFYNFQAVFDPEVDKGQQLSFQTTIGEWINICDLLEPARLATYYHTLFELKTDESELYTILSKYDNPLKVLCDYLAKNAVRKPINPVISMGIKCHEAAIFKAIKMRLEKKDIDTKNFMPSSALNPFFHKHGGALVEIVNTMVPGMLKSYQYEENAVQKIGVYLFLPAIIAAILAFFYPIGWIVVILWAVSFLLIYIGSKLKPGKLEIENFQTIRDLVMGIKVKLAE